MVRLEGMEYFPIEIVKKQDPDEEYDPDTFGHALEPYVYVAVNEQQTNALRKCFSTPVLIRSNQSVQIILVAGMLARLDYNTRPSVSGLSRVYLSSWCLGKKFSVFEAK